AFQTILGLLEDGDIIVDGGNSNFRDSQRRAAEAAKKSVAFLDAGVSGGIWGLKEGYCIMVGGDATAYRHVEPCLKDLTEPGGHLHVGPSGSGHFVKMVHNGIEYGMMQSLAEGFEIMQASEFKVNLDKVAQLWQHGSVVRSWLLDLLVLALEQDPGLEKIRGYVDDSGEGRWTVFEAINESVPAPVITLSLFARFASRQDESFSAKVNAALRQQFGGHAVKAAGEKCKPVAGGFGPPAHTGALRARHLRRLGRPDPAQALSGGLLACRPQHAAGALRDRRRRPHERDGRHVPEADERGGAGVRARQVRPADLE